MKIAICINHFPIGGVGTSTFILANGMRKAGLKADIITTDGQIGTDYLRAYKNGWPIEAICLNELWLRKRLKITYERLKKYDVVINNNSIETQLLLPALPAHIIRLSVIRSTNEPNYRRKLMQPLFGRISCNFSRGRKIIKRVKRQVSLCNDSKFCKYYIGLQTKVKKASRIGIFWQIDKH